MVTWTLFALVCLLLAPTGAIAAPNWTTYRHDAGRSGIDPDSTNPVPPTTAWTSATLDASVIGQPLVYGTNVYVATSNDTVYALNQATGALVWHTHLATPEDSSQAPCGTLGPTIGITSTPVIDPVTNRLYAVGAVNTGSGVAHKLFALDTATGQPVLGFPKSAEPPLPSGASPAAALQRAALGLQGDRVLVGYGGNYGDCSTYWGWLLSISTSSGSTLSFQAQSGTGHSRGAIWGSGDGPAIDSAGRVWVATGNGSSGTTFDFGESVIGFDAALNMTGYWAPSNFATLDTSDQDIGSGEPLPLPGGLLFQAGKDGNAYLISEANPGMVGAPAATLANVCPGGVSSGSFGGGVLSRDGSTIYMPCTGTLLKAGGLRAFTLGTSPPSLTLKTSFTAPSDASGPPILAGGLVWVTGGSTPNAAQKLYGLDPATGQASFTLALTGAAHFTTASAGGGRLYVADGNLVRALTIAKVTPPPPPTPALSALKLTPNVLTVTGRKSHGKCVKATAKNHRARHCRLHAALRLAYSLNVAASVRLRFELEATGRRVKGRCVAQTKRNSKHTRCPLPPRIVRTMTLSGQAGANTSSLSLGRLGPGRYLLTLTPSAAQRTGTTKTLRFSAR